MGFFGFLFDTDSSFGRIMSKISLIVISNLLFIIFSIPVITIGASYTALCHVMMTSFRSKTEVHVFEEFMTGFKQNFKQATLGFGLMIFCFICGIGYLWLCSVFGGLSIYFAFAVYFIFLFILLFFLYLFAVIAAFKGTFKELLRNCFFLIMHRPLMALLVLGIFIVPIALMLIDRVNQPTYVFCFFFFGFALINRISMWLLLKDFEHYLPRRDE